MDSLLRVEEIPLFLSSLDGEGGGGGESNSESKFIGL